MSLDPAAGGAELADAAGSDAAAGGDAAAGPDAVARLDDALSPLRRLVLYARKDPGGARFFDANALRWIGEARRAAGDDPAADELAGFAALLDGWGPLDADARIERIERLYQGIVRFDALHGLPLPPRRRPRSRRDTRPPRPAPEPTADGKRAEPPRADAPKAEPAPKAEKRPARAEPEPPKPAPQAAKPEPRPRTPEPPKAPGLDARLTEVGVPGPLAAALAAAGVETVADLLVCAPESEELVHPIHGAGREIPVGRVAVGGRVLRRWSVVRPDGTREDRVVLQGAGPVTAVWTSETPDVLRAAWLDVLAPDTRTNLVGTWTEEGGGRLVDAEPAPDDGKHGVRLGSTSGIDARLIRAALQAAAPAMAKLRDPMPPEILALAKVPALGEALVDVHQRGGAKPDARRRLAFDEAFLVQLALAWPRFAGQRDRGIAHPLQHGLIARVLASAGLELTDAMATAFEDIKRDLRRPSPMMRVLDGPPGSGRALVAMLAAIQVAESRAQVMVLCPDAAAADHRLALVEPLLRDAGLVGRSLGGDVPRAVRDALRRGELHVVFGGPDLLAAGLEFRRLGLLVAFERPPYGEVVRRVADGRMGRPDLLIVPAARATAATVAAAWPHLDVTRIDAPRRGRLTTEVAPASRRAEIYAKAAASVRKHEQAMVVFPLVDGADALDLREALRAMRALESEAFAGLRVGLFHGSMPREDRARVYDDFRHHRLDVLVATGSVEDGPGVPRLTTLVVEQAESASHLRLRHLVSSLTGPRPWVGMIVADDADPAAVDGLDALRRADRGAEPIWRLADAKAEPPGPSWRWLDLQADAEPWWLARRLAHELHLDDPGLRRSAELARLARERWADWFPAVDGDEDDAEEEAGWPCPIPESAQPGGDKKKRRRRRKRR